MTLREAANKGITKLRLPHWISPHAYLEIDIAPDGYPRVWGRLYDGPTQKVIGAETPQNVPLVGDTSEDWEEYSEPIDTA